MATFVYLVILAIILHLYIDWQLKRLRRDILRSFATRIPINVQQPSALPYTYASVIPSPSEIATAANSVATEWNNPTSTISNGGGFLDAFQGDVFAKFEGAPPP